MRYIEKREEPDSLTRYKQNANAYFDGYGQKDDIRKKLLQEQGRLCGYCMRRISDYSKVKIEHIVPQSRLKDNEREALNYKSMLGVCYGNEKKVNPFDKTCIDKIKYKSDGHIYSDDIELEQDLDVTLNLNYDGADAYLVMNRREVLNACKEKLAKMKKNGMWSKSMLRKVLKEYEMPDEQGRLKPYSGIVLWYLEKRLNQ
ncbi:hypothetical protein AALB51_04165 [Lachnospiraceae bacterium 62-26]